MMSNEPEPSAIPHGFAHIDVGASLKDVKKVWGALREQDALNPDEDDTSAAQTALYCSHFLSTWGQVLHYTFLLWGVGGPIDAGLLSDS